jgi:flagellar biosynthesis anti-sigma factor FlgM
VQEIGEIMRVDYSNFGAEPQDHKTGRAGQTGEEKTASDSSSTTGGISNVDQASLSFDQTRVQALATQVLAQPEVREAKVQALQQAVGDGEYSVPPSQIANALVSELSGAQG